MNTLAMANPVSHVINHKFLELADGTWIWSSAQTNLVITTIIMLTLGLWIASKIDTGPERDGHDRYVTKNFLAHMVEVICVYLRDKVIEPLLHERTARYMPFLLALFFFILINNLLGLIPLLDLAHLLNKNWKADHVSPIGGTATQSIWVTGALAVVAGIAINVAGIKELGFGGYVKHLTADAPKFVWPIIIQKEIQENRKNQAQNNTVAKLRKIERQKHVYAMDLQGYQNKEISEKLNVSLSTVEKDLHEIQIEAKNWFKQVSSSGLSKSLIDAVLQIDIVQKELWKFYRGETKKESKIKILDSIVNTSMKKKSLYWTSGMKPSWNGMGT